MEKFARRCDITGRGMNEGYVFGDGELCFAEKEDLIKHLRTLEWEDANGKRSKDIEDDAELMNYFYREDLYYYTEWDFYDIDDEWYDAEGNEYNN
jgi:hypothetical protein